MCVRGMTQDRCYWLVCLQQKLKKHNMKYHLVPEDKEFTFKKLCPYCKGDLTYRPNGWEQDDEGLWMADGFDVECHSMPSFKSKKFAEWMREHSEMTYVHQLPIDEAVKEKINAKYRFVLSDADKRSWKGSI
jgi:hypothetical protein